ncbi:filamentous hemagglutinin outer membrane protein [Caballeronia ptereochthonis]|uniref:Filamentous hemagglutinin outer membrane protein n=1 Tax=Caballeronia ptereochthonis TaxID=1777144 RepID=A0A158ECU0_9BURK|nr:filamentous hemagglutinin outer membrane protein [Caballeronia ptereochthonis]
MANGKTPDVKLEVSYGSSHSESSASSDTTSNRGSNVTAGGTAAFVATGNGTAGSGNVTIAGSSVNANDVVIAAKNAVSLVNTTDTDSNRSASSSHSASGGVSFGTGGWGVDASASNSHGNANTDSTAQNATHINAAKGATILSGGDTNITGSTIHGRQINADVGGNLNIASVQDTATSAAHQDSSGGGFSVSTNGGASGTYSTQHGNANGNYAQVNEQAGIYAGDGGFNVNVKGNTDLKGAVIASTADASKNTFNTGTLTYSDIINQSNYNASSSGFSAGGTVGDGGNNYATHGPTSGTNAGGGAPMISQHDSGSVTATTRSAISVGTINVTDGAHQQQDIASLSRDTTSTNAQVAKLPDVNDILVKQSDTMNAASTAGEAVARRIGDYANAKLDETGDPRWAEGGSNRIALHVAGGTLVAGLGGGRAIGGAAGAAISSIAADKLTSLSGGIAGAAGGSDAANALGNIVADALATAAGGAIAGSSGAASAYDVDRYNRQLHPDEKQAIKNLANGDADKEHRLEAAGCALVHCAAEYAPGTANYAKYSALEQEGAAFTVEQAQLRNYNGASFSTAGYGGMVRQTPGSSLFQYSTDDTQTDQKSSLAAMAAQRPGSVDYVTIQYGAGVGGGLTINTHNGNLYYGASVAASRSVGGAVTAGVITDNVGQNAPDKGKLTDEFLAGQSVGGSGCAFGACLGTNHSIGGSTAFEFGVGFGGFTKTPNIDGNAAFGYSGQIPNPLKKQ